MKAGNVQVTSCDKEKEVKVTFEAARRVTRLLRPTNYCSGKQKVLVSNTCHIREEVNRMIQLVTRKRSNKALAPNGNHHAVPTTGFKWED